MDWLQVVVLSLVQGITEFLPISSSAHLILFPHLAGWPDQGLDFDVATHLGTLLAIVTYFRHDLVRMGRAFVESLSGGGLSTDARLAWAVLLGTIPVGLAGLVFKGIVETELRSPLVIAWTTLGFGVLLWLADRRARAHAAPRDERQLNWRDVLVIGAAQALALVPGTSRSGITMTAALFLGLSRSAAARFSFLLSIPVIVLASGLSTLDLLRESAPVDWTDLGLGVLFSALSAYACVALFLRFIERTGMLPYVIYRLLLGLFLLAVF